MEKGNLTNFEGKRCGNYLFYFISSRIKSNLGLSIFKMAWTFQGEDVLAALKEYVTHLKPKQTDNRLKLGI